MADPETYRVKIAGTSPLLMHAPVGIGDRPTRRRGEHINPREEAETYLYKDAEGNISIPAANIKACLREAGRNYKISGRKTTFAAFIRAGIQIFPSMVPLIHESWETDMRPVVIQRQRIMRARPRFDSWALKFEIKNNDSAIINQETVKKIITDAGRYYGLGDFRPEFGLFILQAFEQVNAGQGVAR